MQSGLLCERMVNSKRQLLLSSGRTGRRSKKAGSQLDLQLDLYGCKWCAGMTGRALPRGCAWAAMWHEGKEHRKQTERGGRDYIKVWTPEDRKGNRCYIFSMMWKRTHFHSPPSDDLWLSEINTHVTHIRTLSQIHFCFTEQTRYTHIMSLLTETTHWCRNSYSDCVCVCLCACVRARARVSFHLAEIDNKTVFSCLLLAAVKPFSTH